MAEALSETIKSDTVKLDKRGSGVLMVAHRGLSGLETENTQCAFVAAANRSYYGIETDVHVTKDGRYVISHDGNLSRVSGKISKSRIIYTKICVK